MCEAVWGTLLMCFPILEVTGMQDASSHHGIGTGVTHNGRTRAGWVLGILAVVPLVLLVVVAYDFATNGYVEGEALLGRVLIGFFASVAVFMGLLAAALIRSGRSGSDIDRLFTIGFGVAVVGGLLGLSAPGGVRIAAVVATGVGAVLMGWGVVRT